MKAKATTPGFGEVVAQRLIVQIKAEKAPWQRPWVPGRRPLPRNPVSDTQYRGLNRLVLMGSGRNDTRWMTCRQAESLGAQVGKGEKGTHAKAMRVWPPGFRCPRTRDATTGFAPS